MTATTTPSVPRRRLIGEDGVPEVELRNYADGWLTDLLVHMLRVRCVDQRMLKLQRAGRIGFVGSMLGQEAAMIGTAAANQMFAMRSAMAQTVIGLQREQPGVL